MAVHLLGVPLGAGAGRGGCENGPGAFRRAALREALSGAGRAVVDSGDVTCGRRDSERHEPRPGLRNLTEVAGWSHAIHDAVRSIPARDLPLILGGDHSLSLGTVPALAARAAGMGRPLFLLWLDAHPDCHSLASSVSGNLHGLPLAHALGANGPNAPFPGGQAVVSPENVLMLGIREVDPAEERFIVSRNLASHGPSAIRSAGLAPILEPWLRRIEAVGGMLHVSLDADVLDPAVAPGVGTPVAGGLSREEVAEAMDIVAASGQLGSLELVEVNPFLDRSGGTAKVVVDLAVKALRCADAIENRRIAP